MAYVDVAGQGKLWVADKASLPLLVVFGGVALTPSQMDGVKRPKDDDKPVQSSDYMWKYMDPLNKRFHIFVSLSPDSVNGIKAYDELMKVVTDHKLAPSQQILYLFSGGWLPGMHLLRNKTYLAKFSAIFLVDIWMGIGRRSGTLSPDFYTHFVNTNADRVTYVYTKVGPDNDDARDKLVNKLGSQRATKVEVQNDDKAYMTHLRTNTVATGLLP